jgi:hypothetical protein
LFGGEIRSSLNGLYADRAIESLVASINHANQYAAVLTEKEFGNAASLSIVSRVGSVSNPNGKRPLRVRQIGGAVLTAEVAVTGSGMIGARFARKFNVQLDIAAMTTSTHFVH